MELPFAVESPTVSPAQGSALQQSDSSLVTASSQGSFMDTSHFDGPLPPNTPQDVVLPLFQARVQQPQQAHPSRPPPPRISGALPNQVEQDEPEVIDFTYVNISEGDADYDDNDDDDVGILLEGGDMDTQPETQRGDILAVLLSGLEHDGNDSLLVSGLHRS
jgi:hypothetical protein